MCDAMAEVIESAIEKEMQTSYIDYAMSVIVGRALPDARDGLKPVQRRILYSMYKLNNTHNQPTKKSARIVGECMGKYHPHGDAAIYEALMRMAQPFTLNHKLVDGQGNIGSIDGDPPAAARYTEARLSKLGEELLEDIDKDTVKMVSNFDNTETEPLTLPSKVPTLLLNGSSGIAVGVATNILPHNLGEICDAISAYIQNKEITIEQLANYIKGPDFPTGGIVFYNSGLYSSYLTGRGSVTIRGAVKVEESKSGSTIIITEIPFNVNKAQLVQQIAELAKSKKIQGVSGIRDESGKEGIRILVELRKDGNADYIINLLYAHTQLQITNPVMNIAVLDNSLLTVNLRQFIEIFVDYRFEVVTKRTKFNLASCEERLHIVEGLLIATDNINEVISLIKSSDDTKAARAALVRAYSISERQANAILDMKLSRLTSLEASSLRTEQTDLNLKIKQYKEALGSPDIIYSIINEETSYVKQHYATPRRTQIERSELPIEIEQEDLIEDTDTTILLTSNNYMKRLPVKSYKMQERGGKGTRAIELKEGDFAKQTLYCRTKDTLLSISTKGRAYWIKAYRVPEGDRYSVGKAAINLFQLQEGEKVEKLINTREFANSFIVFVTEHGLIKRVRAEKFSHQRVSGIKAVPLRENDSLADACISEGKSELFVSTKSGKSIRFSETELRPASRASHGVRGIRIKQNDSITNVIAVGSSDYVMSITERGFGKVTELGRYRLQHRGGGGVLNIKINDKTGNVVKSLKVSNSDSVLLISSVGISIQFPVSSIRKTGRAASGVRMMRLEKGSRVVDAQIVKGEQQKESLGDPTETPPNNGI